jgi:hypothetical protein
MLVCIPGDLNCQEQNRIPPASLPAKYDEKPTLKKAGAGAERAG